MHFDIRGFSVQLQTYRIAAGLTQEKLAEMTGLSAHYIGNLEQSKRSPSISSIIRICNALCVSPEQLLKDSLSEDLLVLLSNEHTLREPAEAITHALSSLLPLDDEEAPTLFGVPIDQIPDPPAEKTFSSLFDDILLFPD